jgi:chorismate mutase/prephenate dehydratase
MDYLSARYRGLAMPRRARAVIGREDLVRSGLRAMPIPDDRENKTRFLILGLGEAAKGRLNKTSIMFALKDKPGALHDSLVPFKRNRINLTKIESRPSKRRAWEYLFFIDVEGHVSEPRVHRALQGLQRHTTAFQLLGSYPMSNR